MLCNCDSSGILIDLKTPAKYLESKSWVILSVREFEVYGKQTPVPICHNCNDSIESISTKQTLEMLSEHICNHSRIAANLIRDFDCCWHLDGALQLSPDEVEKNRVDIFHIREGSSTSSQTLALVFRKDKMSIIYSTGRQITPVCSSCTATKCVCLRLWKLEMDKNVVSSNTQSEDESKKPHHYFLQDTSYPNDSPIPYPLQSCSIQREIIKSKESGTFSLPSELIPTYDDQKRCRNHGHPFISDDSGLALVSKSVKIYSETGATEHECNLYVRKSQSCKCIQQVDGHPWLLFHIGWGKMVCYLTLDAYVIDMVRSGSTVR